MKIKALGNSTTSLQILDLCEKPEWSLCHSKKFGAPPSPSDDRIFLNNLKFTPTWNADLGIHFFGHMLHHISAVHKDKNFRSLEAEHFLLQKRIYIFPDIAQATQAWIKKMTLKAEFSSLGINTVILFPATFSILLEEEKNVLHKCRDVEHILMTHIKAIRGHEDANKRFWSYKIIQLKIHFSVTLLSFFSLCAFFFFFFFPLYYIKKMLYERLKPILPKQYSPEEYHSHWGTESDLLFCLPVWNLLYT